MICHPSNLVPAAKRAGMKTPYLPDNYEELKNDYIHFYIFCKLQLDRPLDWDEAKWEESEHNAKIIASIPTEEITQLTLGDLILKGFKYRDY
jgi:hypothetical protein